MYDIIKRYVENENENGLLLVDMPTGSGKTYSAIEFIYKDTVLKKVSEKAKKCGCKCVVIANIYAEGQWDISDVQVDGIRIISLPCLVKNTNGKLCFDKEAWDILRRCVDEFKY